MMFKFYIWVMGWSGKINTWAWNKQVDIVRANQRKEEEDYLKELGFYEMMNVWPDKIFCR